MSPALSDFVKIGLIFDSNPVLIGVLYLYAGSKLLNQSISECMTSNTFIKAGEFLNRFSTSSHKSPS